MDDSKFLSVEDDGEVQIIKQFVYNSEGIILHKYNST